MEKQQEPAYFVLEASQKGDVQMFPIMYPALTSGVFKSQNQEQMNRGGIYAVPILPFMNPVAGFPPNTLIPLTYSTPTRTSSSEAATASEQGQPGQQQQLQQQNLQAPQRPAVVRRFQIVIQFDLSLILKLGVAIYLLNQHGSRQRLVLLVFLAALVYLYQTGVLTPLVQWLSQRMQRAAAPLRPPRPAARPDNILPAARQGNENDDRGEGHPEGENENESLLDGNRAFENNEQVVEPGANNGGNRWLGIMKEIQMIVSGVITSLLPGFHNIDE